MEIPGLPKESVLLQGLSRQLLVLFLSQRYLDRKSLCLWHRGISQDGQRSRADCRGGSSPPCCVP